MAEKNWHRLTGGSHSREKDGRPVPIAVRGPEKEKLTLARGDVFEPTAFELETIGDKLDALNKAPSAVEPEPVDFAFRGLQFASEEALVAAVQADLSPDDFKGVTPSAKSGFGASQVRELAEAKGAGQKEGAGEGETGGGSGEE
jgi:hypothetical protein